LLDPVLMGGYSQIWEEVATRIVVPHLRYIEIDGMDAGALREQHRIGGLPNLHRVGAIRERIAKQTRGGGVEHLQRFRIDALLLREPFKHGKIGGALGGGNLSAFEIGKRLDVGTVRYRRAPVVEQIEEVADLDAPCVAKAEDQHRSAAADLELARVELRRIGIGRPL